MTTQKLFKLLVPPSKIATVLNWQKASGSILSLDIHKDRIGMAISSHPVFQKTAKTLESIRLRPHGEVPDQAKEELTKIIGENNVCGVVVSWPLQRDTGKMGAACGRTIHTLEDLIKDSKVISLDQPVCFWDGVHPKQPKIDKWGRCSDFGRTPDPDKHIHVASKEQYDQNENIVAAQVWSDFVKTHWPDVYEANRWRTDELAG